MASNKRSDVELVISAKNEATKTLNEIVKSLNAISEQGDGAKGAIGFFRRFTKGTDDAAKSQEEFSKRQKQVTKDLKDATTAQRQLEKANKQRERDLDSQRGVIDRLKQSLVELEKAQEEYARSATEARTPSKALTDQFESQRTKQQQLVQSIQELRSKIAGAEQVRDSGQIDDKAAQQIANQRQKVIDLGRAWRDTQEAVTNARGQLAALESDRNQKSSAATAAKEQLDTLQKQLTVVKEIEAATRKALASPESNADLDAEQKKLQSIREQVKAAEKLVQTRKAENEIANSDKSKDQLAQARTMLKALRDQRDVQREIVESKKSEAAASNVSRVQEKQADLKKAIAEREQLQAAIKEQIKVERELRGESNKAGSAYDKQVREIDKLIEKAGQQKKAYNDLKAALDQFEKDQGKASFERQQKDVEKLVQQLNKLESEYQSIGDKIAATNQRIDQASSPSQASIKKYEELKKSIEEKKNAVTAATQKLGEMEAGYREAGVAAAQLARVEIELKRTTDQLTKEQQELVVALDKTGKTASKAANDAKSFNKNIFGGDGSRQSLSYLQRIRGELLSIAATYTGLYAVGGGVRSIYDAAVVTQKATARLSAKFNGDTQAIGEEIAYVRAEADRLGLSYETLLDQYTKFISNVPDGTLNLEQMRFTFSGIAEAARVVGLSNDDVNATFYALGQIASKGAVQLEELKGQLGERIPKAVESMAVGLSKAQGELITTEELLKRINKGELNSDAIVAFAAALKEEFGPELQTALKSPQASLEKFRTQLFFLREEIAKSGFLDELINGLNGVTEILKTPEFKDGAKALATGIAGLIRLLVSMIKYVDEFAIVIGAALGVKAILAVTTMTGALIKLSLATKTAAGAFLTLRTASLAVNAALTALLAGFFFGNWLREQSADVQKFGVMMVDIFERLRIKATQALDTVKAYIEQGWGAVLGAVVKNVLLVAPKAVATAISYLLNLIANKIASVSTTVADLIRKFADNISAEKIDATVDVVTGVDGDEEFKAKLRAINKTANEESEKLKATIGDMVASIDAEFAKRNGQDAPKILDPKDAKSQAEVFREELFKGLQFFRQSFDVSGLETELKRITEALETESADTLEKKLKLIEKEFNDFLSKVDSFSGGVDDEILRVQVKAMERMDAIQKSLNAGTGDRVRQEADIAQIRKDTEEQILKLRQQQASISGARAAAQQLVALRQQQLIAEEQENNAREAEQKINDLLEQRRNKLDKINELAEYNLITTEEQGIRLNQVNDEYLSKIREAVEEARKLGELTQNQKLIDFAAGFESFEELEKRRAITEQLKLLEQEINDKIAERDTRINTINLLNEAGIPTQQTVRDVLIESNAELDKMIQKAIALAEANGLSTVKLKEVQAGLQGTKTAILDAATVNRQFASGFTNAIEGFIKGTMSARDAFRQFASDFLAQIARMIIQQTILNAISGGAAGGGAGGIGGVIAGVFNHEGGIVGRHGRRRWVSPAVFANAIRMHNGGLVGLKNDEVPTILQKGERVIPKDEVDKESSQSPMNVSVVNAIDSGSFISEGLKSQEGRQAILNFIRANRV